MEIRVYFVFEHFESTILKLIIFGFFEISDTKISGYQVLIYLVCIQKFFCVIVHITQIKNLNHSE